MFYVSSRPSAARIQQICKVLGINQKQILYRRGPITLAMVTTLFQDAQGSAWNQEASSWGRPDAPLQELDSSWKTLLVCLELKNKWQNAEEMDREVPWCKGFLVLEQIMNKPDLLECYSSCALICCWALYDVHQQNRGSKLRRSGTRVLLEATQFRRCLVPKVCENKKGFWGMQFGTVASWPLRSFKKGNCCEVWHLQPGNLTVSPRK